MGDLETALRRFEAPDEGREFEEGRLELLRIGGLTIGRATYQPGWQLSEHVGAASGCSVCDVEPVTLVVSGTATAAMTDGKVYEATASDLFHIPPGHDRWVVGIEPYVSLYFPGAADDAVSETHVGQRDSPTSPTGSGRSAC